MSLESKIEQLIAAIELQTKTITGFNDNIEKWLTAPISQSQKIEVSPESEAPSTTVTEKDVQDKVLAFVRKDEGKNKPIVKALLDEFKANKVSDLGDNLAAFNVKLDAL